MMFLLGFVGMGAATQIRQKRKMKKTTVLEQNTFEYDNGGCRGTARYNITVDVTWTKRTHPLSPAEGFFWDRLVLLSHDPRHASA